MAAQAAKVRSILWIGVLVIAMVALAAGERLTGVILPLLVRTIISVGALALTVWFLLGYWAQIDEAAKEAQKSAWLWGGSMGMAIGFIADAVLSLPQVYPHARSVVLHLGGALIVGGGLVALSAALGFLMGWAIWWSVKR